MLENDEWKSDIIPEIMDGKNIADFIDPDILEKLDALEREEEKLEADGFYDSGSDMVRPSPSPALRAHTNHASYQFDSDDERDAAAMKISRAKKLVSQNTKRAMKNRAALPRTAGLRTLTELTTEMTKAGLDPSRIQERAEMLAKVQGAKRKRQREEDEAEMDVDEEMGDESGEGEGEWMDVDGDEVPKLKRAKANSGAVIAKNARHSRSNRQLAGLRGEVPVSARQRVHGRLMPMRPFLSPSKHRKRPSGGISGRESATCKPAPERATAPSKPKWYVHFCTLAA